MLYFSGQATLSRWYKKYLRKTNKPKNLASFCVDWFGVQQFHCYIWARKHMCPSNWHRHCEFGFISSPYFIIGIQTNWRWHTYKQKRSLVPTIRKSKSRPFPHRFTQNKKTTNEQQLFIYGMGLATITLCLFVILTNTALENNQQTDENNLLHFLLDVERKQYECSMHKHIHPIINESELRACPKKLAEHLMIIFPRKS